NKSTQDPNNPNNMDPNNPNNKNKDTQDPNNPDPNKSPDNPLDIFKDLFNNASKGDDAPPSFSLDPAAVSKITESLNFVGQLDEASIEGLKSGDVEKITSILNGVGRNAYATLMQHIPALTEKYVAARLEH